jgi:purine-nucleoside phosphorylase
MLYDQIQESSEYIKARVSLNPVAGIILGTGLGKLADDIDAAAVFDYSEIPHFPVSTVHGHRGQLLFGNLSGISVVAMVGRFHYYEGYSLQQVTFPVRVMKFLGIERIVLSNAAGSVNPSHKIGDVVIIKDHINLLPDNPLRGPNDERLGVRFPDLMHTYDKDMIERALQIGKNLGIHFHTGVLAALTGPNLETPAEYTYLHRIGADLAGMSVIPEALVAKHSGIKTFAMSAVTDLGYPPEAIRETSHEDVIEAAGRCGVKMRKLVPELLKSYY